MGGLDILHQGHFAKLRVTFAHQILHKVAKFNQGACIVVQFLVQNGRSM